MKQTDLVNFAFAYTHELIKAIEHLDLAKLADAAQQIKLCQGTVWLIGNGGSAALASHMATDLQLAGVRAIALMDVAAITTYANDQGFNYSFRNQLRALAKHGDLLIAISGSGNSTNIIVACAWANANGLATIGVSGFGGGALRTVVDLHLHAPASHMGQAQDVEQIMLHIICYWLMQAK